MDATPKPHILFTGGGSAGHTVPVLAVMAAVQGQQPEARCTYVGTAADLRSTTVAESPLRFERYAIRTGKLNRFVTWRHVSELFGLLAGFWQAFWLLRRLRPDAVFASGSAVMVPVARAAFWLGIPAYALEVNNELGLANRIVAWGLTRIFTAFPAEQYRVGKEAHGKLRFVGRPVRPEFFQPADGPVSVEGREVGSPVITVVGGSQGAHRINELVQQAWPSYLAAGHLAHICGAADLPWLEQEAERLPADQRARLHLTDFLTEGLPQLFQRSQAVISRSGGTVIELAASGAAAILLPHGSGSSGHQAANARMLEAAGAAVVLDESQTSPQELADWALNLEAKADVELMRQAIRAFARRDAAQVMATEMLEAIGHGG